jgi:hypothetical protein
LLNHNQNTQFHSQQLTLAKVLLPNLDEPIDWYVQPAKYYSQYRSDLPVGEHNKLRLHLQNVDNILSSSLSEFTASSPLDQPNQESNYPENFNKIVELIQRKQNSLETVKL